MQDYTVMIFRDHASPVRRYKVARRLVKRAGAMAVGAVLLTGLLLVDYVRVRGDVVELDALREETHQQREEIERFTTRMQELDERFARLRDFERKVRVIADLPRSGVAEVGEVPSGVGGGFESDDPDAAEASDLPPATGDPSTAPGASGPVTAPMGSWFARLDRDARALLVATRVREESLEDLVERLRGKSERLASTPSVWPAKGWLTSKFGRRVSPFTGKVKNANSTWLIGQPLDADLRQAGCRVRVFRIGRPRGCRRQHHCHPPWQRPPTARHRLRLPYRLGAQRR